MGCYFGYVELINMDGEADDANEKGLRYFWCDWGRLIKERGVAYSSIIGWVSYLVGATFYQVNVFMDLFVDVPEEILPGYRLTESQTMLFVKWPSCIGGLLFFVGGICEIVHNKCYAKAPVTAVWWVSVLNTVGGFYFFIMTFPSVMQHVPNLFGALKGREAAFTEAFGTTLYLLGSILSLYMWRGEHFGLALLSVLNEATDSKITLEASRADGSPVLKVEAPIGKKHVADGADPDDGPNVMEPRLSFAALLFLLFYIAVGAIQSLAMCTKTVYIPPFHAVDASYKGRERAHAFLASFLFVSFMYLVLVYKSANVRLPKERPYREIGIAMRLASVVLLVNSCLNLDLILERDAYAEEHARLI